MKEQTFDEFLKHSYPGFGFQVEKIMNVVYLVRKTKAVAIDTFESYPASYFIRSPNGGFVEYNFFDLTQTKEGEADGIQ